MDTQKLVVGQDVYLLSGVYCTKGKVVKVTPSGVEVHDAIELFGFDIYGEGCDGHKTHECGPWEIDDMPFAERTASFNLKRNSQRAGVPGHLLLSLDGGKTWSDMENTVSNLENICSGSFCPPSDVIFEQVIFDTGERCHVELGKFIRLD